MHMRKLIPLRLSAGALAFTLLLPVIGHSVETTQTGYETGFETISKIATDLHDGLDTKYRAKLRSAPVLDEKAAAPALQTQEGDGTNPIQAVHVSRGFIDLMNFISHAKAIDTNTRGFLAKSMARLATDPALPDLRAGAARNTWSLATMNRQASHFNQMAGALIAIDLAHFSLGHYQKYASQLADAQSQPISINSVVTPAEWREAVLKGAQSALDCGLAVDGLKVLFESIDNMPSRPPWTIFLMPSGVNVSKLNRELDSIQRKAFL